MIEKAIPIVRDAEIFVVAGTSLVVYPAAGLVNYTQPGIPVYVLDKKIPYVSSNGNLVTLEKPATEGIKELISLLKNNF